MTPSNPSNQNPFILCIMDALGIPHQVAPLEHTHTYAEVPGLNDELGELWAGLGEKANQEDVTEALAGKQGTLTFDSTPTANSTNPVTSGGVKDALDAKRQIRQDDPDTLDHAIVSATANDGDVYIMLSVREGDDIKYVRITLDNILNLQRALEVPAAPISGGDQLITNGEVWDALEGKAPLNIAKVSYFAKSDETEKLNLDTVFDDGKEIANYIIENMLDEGCRIEDFFTSTQGEPFYGSEVIKPASYAVIKIVCLRDGSTTRYFIVVEGMYDM